MTTALATLRAKCPGTLASLLVQLHDNGQIRSALPDDRYLRDAETHGGTPFAYTLPRSDAPRHPVAIVLAKRFMDATPTAQAALLAHEAGHWQAFQERGTSNEYDGYKAEYDAATPLGFSEKDGLAYFAMLDGVVEYVVPRSPAYAKQHDVKDFMESTQDKSLSPK